MNKMIAIVAAAALVSGTTFAQGVDDGSNWVWPDGTTATVDVVDVNPNQHGCTVQVTDSSGFTPATNGTASANSTTENPKADTAPAATTTGGTSFRITKRPSKPSKVEKKNANGDWVPARRSKKAKRGQNRLEPSPFSPGEEGTSLPPERL